MYIPPAALLSAQPFCAASGPARSHSYRPVLQHKGREERKTKVSEAASSLLPFLFSSRHPYGLIPDADGTFSFSGQHNCQEWCGSQRPGVMTSLSLHSGDSEGSYLRALIYNQDVCFGLFFFSLFLELRRLWVPRRKPSVVKLLWKITV